MINESIASVSQPVFITAAAAAAAAAYERYAHFSVITETPKQPEMNIESRDDDGIKWVTALQKWIWMWLRASSVLHDMPNASSQKWR